MLLRDRECKSEIRETLSLNVLRLSWMELIYSPINPHLDNPHGEPISKKYLGVECGHVILRVPNIGSASSRIQDIVARALMGMAHLGYSHTIGGVGPRFTRHFVPPKLNARLFVHCGMTRRPYMCVWWTVELSVIST